MKTTLLTTLGMTALALGLGHSAAHAQDTTPPSLVSAASLDGTTVGLCFSEPMNRAGLEDVFSYLVEDGAGAVSVLGVTIRPGDRALLLRLERAVSSPFTVTLLEPQADLAGNPLPAGSSLTGALWSSDLILADVGGSLPTGSLGSCAPGVLSVEAGGRNIGEAMDQFTYLYVARTNNFDVRVRVDHLLFVGHPTAKAGLHIRDSLDAGSRFFMAYLTPTNGSGEFLARARHLLNQDAREFGFGPPVGAFPVWLRVNRSGPMLTAFYSRDGQSWMQFGSAQHLPLLPPVLLVGLGTVSHLQDTATTAEYRDFGDTPLYPGATFSISRQPTGAVVEANQSANFTVLATASGAPPDALQYQWQAEESPGSGVFTNVFFATTPSYTTPFLRAADSGTRVRVVVSISGHLPLVSDAVTITVGPDVTAPRAISALGTRSLREITVTFSEPLARTSAEQAQNYAVAGFSVTNAALDGAGTTVTLALDGKQTPGGTNMVQITGVRDLAGRPADPQTIAAPAFILARGFALQELYFGIPGAAMADLRDAEKFPAGPDQVSYVSLLEGPLDVYEYYGTRISGFLVPPVSANYHFFVCSDDLGEFWLSTDDDPVNRVLLCREPQWMGSRNYTNIVEGGTRTASGPENRSATLFPAGIPLVAGRLYYFEALNKEGWGGDNLSVAWQWPGVPLPETGSLPIASEFLAVLAPPGSAVQILEEPHDIPYELNPPPPEAIYEAMFDNGDEGYEVTNGGSPQSPWMFNAASGYWFANASQGAPSSSALTSPTFTVPQTGPLTLRFTHRYSFEYTYDGGQVRLSVNGGLFQPVGSTGFCANGYAGTTIVGNGVLKGQSAFHGDSPGYAGGNLITSTVNLGHFNQGDVLAIQFLAAWDESVQGSLPNWLIERVSVTEGECEVPEAFNVRASASAPGDVTPPIRYQWQRDCGSGFVNIPGAITPEYSFVPVTADVACQFRCIVATFSMSATSAVARITLPPIHLRVRREGAFVIVTWNGPAGTLQSALSPAGPWGVAGGATNNTYTVRATGTRRFYRVRVP